MVLTVGHFQAHFSRSWIEVCSAGYVWILYCKSETILLQFILFPTKFGNSMNKNDVGFAKNEEKDSSLVVTNPDAIIYIYTDLLLSTFSQNSSKTVVYRQFQSMGGEHS